MRKGHERYRPTFLACATANKVLGGNLVETTHSGADPKFDATGIFSRGRGMEDVTGLPCLFSYAFADGAKRGLIVVNLDTSKAHPVSVELAGRVKGATATSWLLSADKITANNEFEVAAPQVRIAEGTVTAFKSGRRLVQPPFSMRALRWEVE